jgi:hypothetical protein
MGDIERLKAEWRAAVEGMMFFGEPVQDMTSEQLLLVIGHLVTENIRLKHELPGQEVQSVRRMTGGGWMVVSQGLPGRDGPHQYYDKPLTDEEVSYWNNQDDQGFLD